MSEPSTNNEPISARSLLRDTPLFGHLSEQALAELEGELEWFAMPGGATLFEFGDPSDALYVLKAGSLGAFKPDSSGKFRLDGVVAAGETVGELGLIIDQPRSATVRTLRDCELLRLSRRGFEALATHHPEAMLRTARLAVQRLVMRSAGSRPSAPRTFAVLPHDAGVDARGFADRLREALARYGECALIDAAAGAGQTSAWFSALEARSRTSSILATARRPIGASCACVRPTVCCCSRSLRRIRAHGRMPVMPPPNRRCIGRVIWCCCTMVRFCAAPRRAG